MNQSRWADPPPALTTNTEARDSHALQTSAQHVASDNGDAAASVEPPHPVVVVAPAHIFSASDSSAPPPDVATAEAFAQTGAQQDDLFDDVVPVEESMRIRSDDDLFSDDFTPAPQPVVEQQASPPVPTETRLPADAIRLRGRGRGRGRGPNEVRAARPRRDARHVEDARKEDGKQQAPRREGAVPSNAPTGPRKETPASVKGDRFATGGVHKPKLTEEELAEKMAKIHIKNASLTAAHARAQADAASFAEREQQAKQVSHQRRKEERKDRQQMMGEREKNRQRKLKAMDGREWDAEKNDADFARGGRFDKKGGFAGDKEDYTDGREYLYRGPRGGDRKQGDPQAARGGPPQSPSVPPKREDFPELPNAPRAGVANVDTTLDSGPNPSGRSWADQVEAS